MAEPTPGERAADEILSLIKQKVGSIVVPIPTRRQILSRVRVAVIAERERCAKVVDTCIECSCGYCADKIRKGPDA